jgi:hypothetical protein
MQTRDPLTRSKAAHQRRCTAYSVRLNTEHLPIATSPTEKPPAVLSKECHTARAFAAHCDSERHRQSVETFERGMFEGVRVACHYTLYTLLAYPKPWLAATDAALFVPESAPSASPPLTPNSESAQQKLLRHRHGVYTSEEINAAPMQYFPGFARACKQHN